MVRLDSKIYLEEGLDDDWRLVQAKNQQQYTVIHTDQQIIGFALIAIVIILYHSGVES